MDVPSVINVATVTSTIVAASVAALQRGIVTNLREANKDLRDRAGDLETERDDATRENENLKSDLEALGRVVTHEAHITALGDRLETHHTESLRAWDAATTLGQDILTQLKRLSGGTS